LILGVDVGGTFTDAVLIGDGGVHSGKAPTTPEDQSIGVLDAVHAVLDEVGANPGDVTDFAHGMTVATNALLEGAGARTALVTTAGFTDIVEIGRQNRADLYRLRAARPAPLVPPELRVGVVERMGPDGVIRSLGPDQLKRLLDRIEALGVDSVAVCLLHADRHPEHEKLIGAALKEKFGGDLHVSLSHEVVGTFREFERAATTEVDAALSPLLGGYLDLLSNRCRENGLPEPAIMQSSGGLTDLKTASGHAALTVLSGPAGGAAAAALVAEASGRRDLLCFDMGGTSCDVCAVEGGAVRETGNKSIGGHPLALPMVDIDTVGAGGGSIAWRDGGGALRVGPRSAGASPGPACYGRGGTEATVTDANLLLGRLDRDSRLAGGVELDYAAAEAAIGQLADELGLSADECAAGIIRVTNAEMVRALRVMTVGRGLDPRKFSLLAFGGAGPLHAAAIAEELGMETVLVPRLGGVFSALGLAAADTRHDRVRTVMLSEEELTAETLVDLAGDADEVGWDLRYVGQSFELTVNGLTSDPAELRRRFDELHNERYGYSDDEARIQLVTIRQTNRAPGPEPQFGDFEGPETQGPATIALAETTILVPDGWVARPVTSGLIEVVKSA
jgi:N-methylhydantoinase A